jgi:hypothetical protein
LAVDGGKGRRHVVHWVDVAVRGQYRRHWLDNDRGQRRGRWLDNYANGRRPRRRWSGRRLHGRRLKWRRSPKRTLRRRRWLSGDLDRSLFRGHLRYRFPSRYARRRDFVCSGGLAASCRLDWRPIRGRNGEFVGSPLWRWRRGLEGSLGGGTVHLSDVPLLRASSACSS